SGTGINELEKASITISPNPANDFLNLMIKNFSGNLVSISIFSALGQQVKSFSLAKGGSEINSNIDISDLQKGIYFISIANENDKITRKIIIE
ncbi:MAG: T9SS type A sorting domain-containing protein, partial [Bacteroidia bacterium]